MKKLIQEALSRDEWAVLGATIHEEKFGYKIFDRLQLLEKNVTPINPNYSKVKGVACLDSVDLIDGQLSVLSVVVSPELAKKAIDQLDRSSVEYIWFQPGTYNDEVIEAAKCKEIPVIYGHCVLVETAGLA